MYYILTHHIVLYLKRDNSIVLLVIPNDSFAWCSIFFFFVSIQHIRFFVQNVNNRIHLKNCKVLNKSNKIHIYIHIFHEKYIAFLLKTFILYTTVQNQIQVKCGIKLIYSKYRCFMDLMYKPIFFKYHLRDWNLFQKNIKVTNL